MSQKRKAGRSIKDILFAMGPLAALVMALSALALHYANPAPPTHLVISTGNGEGDYDNYAKLYKSILKEDGIDLEIRPSSGASENLKRLETSDSGVDVGFVHDGLGSQEEQPDVSSLGSLYYEPIWVFYRGRNEISRFSQLIGKRVAIGSPRSGTRTLALRLLKASGVDSRNSSFVDVGLEAAVVALRSRQVDAAIFLATPEDPMIDGLAHDPTLRLVSLEQAEAISRLNPYLHHLVLPRGSLDLPSGIPKRDVDLVSATATLLVRDDLHPALIDLLLKAASQVHGEPGILERKDEFPINKDYQFPLSDEAKNYYKSGVPFWQRYLPFWIATLVDRFILIIIPLLALIIPMVRLVPKIYAWRVRSRIYQRYGELKFLETQLKPSSALEKKAEFLAQLDVIEERVNHMKVPLDFSDHVYVLREHIDFVRTRLGRMSKG